LPEFLDADGCESYTTAVAARFVARVSAVPPVTQPPQLNPTIASAIAPARQSRERAFFIVVPSRSPDSSEPVKRRRQSLAHESGQIQILTAFRDVREQYLDKGMLPVGRGASLIFPARDSLKRGKVQLAKRIVLIAEQTLPSSTMLDGLRPNVQYLAAYERLDLFRSILGKKP
jgi:hypothetical protein